MISKYNLFGFDFVFNSEGDIFFLEVNSFPGLLRDQDQFYEESVLDEISKDCNKTSTKLIIIYTHTDYENYREAKYVSEKLGKNTNDFKLLLLDDDQLGSFDESTLADMGAESGLIFTPYVKIRKILFNSKHYALINEIDVSDLSKDKFQVSELLNKNGISIPKTYLLAEYIKADDPELINADQLIIKPRYGEKGNGIHKVAKRELLEFIKKIDEDEIDKNIIQENINVPLENGSYWDIRSFVLNGKYMGSVKRVSENFIVNVSLGGRTQQLNKDLENVVGRYSELCSKIILDHTASKKP